MTINFPMLRDLERAIVRFVPPAQVEEYIAQGWTVEPLPLPHGWYRMLAWRAG